jgi:TonB-dependent receptor
VGKQRLGIDWQASLAQTSRDEPDTRDVSYSVTPDGSLRFRQGPSSGEHYGASLQESQSSAGIHVNLPVAGKSWSVEPAVGAAVQQAERSFDARRFSYQFVGDDPAILFQSANDMLTSDSIGSAFRLDERTLANDAYTADRQILAGYGLVDVKLASDKVRVQPGLRWEQATQDINTGTPFATDGGELRQVHRVDAHLLPAVNATVQLKKDMQLRAGWSRTVARPQFRELAPMLYYDFVRRRNLSGNPDLLPTTIQNADLRWEWFPTAEEVFSLGAFWKGLANPIEQVVANASQGDLSFANATSATAIGVEAEARFGLGRLSKSLRALRAGFSIAAIASEVDLSDQGGPQTNSVRPLQGQSPFAINASLLWHRDRSDTDVALLYNVSGARIAEVGFDTLPDVYDQPQHRLDITVSQRLGKEFALRLALSNLLLADQVLLADDVEVLRVPQGISAGLQLTWSPL